jgi:hypothetical protein
MPAADLNLHDLAQHLAQKQFELDDARRAYEARLADLTHRKDALQAQLRAVDAEIQAVSATAVPSDPGAAAETATSQTEAAKPLPEAKQDAPKRKATATGGGTAKPVAQPGAVSLRELLTRLLAESKRPLKAKELAEQALAAGYQTASKDFVSVVWVAVGKIENVENLQGQGYRLKKAATKAK